MNKLIFFGGLFFCIGGVVLFLSKIKTNELAKKGEIVKMVIVKLPIPCTGTKIQHFATFSYNRKMYVKAIGSVFCENHNIGDSVEMKILEGSPIILFPNESLSPDLISCVLLTIFGLLLCLVYLRKMKL